MPTGVFDSPQLGRIYFDARHPEEMALMHREVVEDESYVRHGIAVRPGDTIVDAGANIGLFLLYADRACGPSGRLVAFEPVPSTFAILEKNAAEHRLLDRPGVTLTNVGLTRADGPRRAPITIFGGLTSNATFDPDTKRLELEAWLQRRVAAYRQALPVESLRRLLVPAMRKEAQAILATEQVECALTTLAEALRALDVPRVDLLKVDVEGAELDLLDGLDAETWPRVRQVVVETGDSARAGEVAERLRGAGFARITTDRPRWAVDLDVPNEHVYGKR